MQRLLTEKLVEWKNNRYRKPLILWGARQVGKTWLMKDLGEKYFENCVYISFYNNKRMAEIFEEDYNPARILQRISIELHTKIEPEKTLIIFDEVQSAMKVVESLKYFCEEAREYAVVAAGSLLGVARHEGFSFPVGKVDELMLHPMNFKEFLLAMDEPELAGFLDNWKNPEVSSFNAKYSDLLKLYFYLGGMPEVVSRYAENRDLAEAREIQLSIISQYEGDFGKHIQSSQLPRINMTWNAIPLQLAKENRKFFFGQVKEGGRMKDFEMAIQWLQNAGLIHKVHKITKPGIPLKSYIDFAAFKLFLIDIGLLGALSELDNASILTGNTVFTEFKGALAEQYVLQELIAGEKYTPYYYSGEKSTYETDFVIQRGSDIIPIEVKAEENLKSKSLRFYCDKFNPVFAVRTSMAKAENQGWMVNIPLWAIGSL
ncbi:ATP-binding protein [bacterium]|nr:ATP-binding protein [bacterium]MBP5202615.1 ATP-binding protein [bacterium]